jgi:DNA-binding IclR family transcriptional regulator
MVISARTGTQSVTRAVALLKAFTEARPEQRLADLARAAQLHRATAHRLLATLEREGMVARDAASDLYRLGPEAIAIGARAVRATDLRGAARCDLAALAASTRETATLEVPVGREMLIIDEVLGHALIGATASIGTRWPMRLTSTGKAVLASAPGRRDAAGRRGYAVASDELERGYSAVGAAILGADGRAVAAISVGGPSLRFTRARISKLGAKVRAAAERISATLGYQKAR